jgi:hypothetical protein
MGRAGDRYREVHGRDDKGEEVPRD